MTKKSLKKHEAWQTYQHSVTEQHLIFFCNSFQVHPPCVTVSVNDFNFISVALWTNDSFWYFTETSNDAKILIQSHNFHPFSCCLATNVTFPLHASYPIFRNIFCIPCIACYQKIWTKIYDGTKIIYVNQTYNTSIILLCKSILCAQWMFLFMVLLNILKLCSKQF